MKDRLSNWKVGDKLRRLAAADSAAQPLLVSGTNIKTINSQSLLGSGNIAISGGSSGYAEGTSFPTSPASGDKFYRSDLNWLCFYDGTRWLTCHEYSLAIAYQNILAPLASSRQVSSSTIRRDYQIYLTRFDCVTYVSTTNNGSSYWNLALIWGNSANTETTLYSTSTSSDSPNVNVSKASNINATLNTGAFYLAVNASRIGSAGNLFASCAIYFRLIVT